MKLILILTNKIKSLLGVNNDINKFKKLDLEELKKTILKCNNILGLRISVIKIHSFMKKYELSFDGEEFKILKEYVKNKKLEISSKINEKNY